MSDNHIRSREIYEHAQQVIPGGVSSNNRLVEPNLVFTRAEGAYIYDADGKQYVDYHAAFGPPILGHSNKEVNAAVSAALTKIDLVGVGANEMEIRLAEKIIEHVPSADKVLFANSGSEATFAALRLSRAVTGRDKIIKFQGCYHGHHDAVLMNVISAPDKMGKKDLLSKGMTQQVVDNTLVLPFNDIEEFARTIQDQGDQIAAVILEPIPHNIGCVMPRPEFLQTLRELTEKKGIVLIFDEVITGFRHGLGGYQKIAGITPDLTSMGKAIANGYPLAALAGRAALMDHCRPGNDVFFAGTFNAHPVGVAASLKTVEILERPETYKHLYTLGERARAGIEQVAKKHKVEMSSTGFGSVFVPYFMSGPINNYNDLLRNDTKKELEFRRGMIQEGLYMLPVAMKRNHVSLAHTQEDIDRTIQAADRVLGALA
ncbi:MAG: aspartate aminotransferase family protein [Anaerolineae bacterium]|nr:aspartate aminotransferase family protein [Anaerolineae bacterium]